MSNQQPDPSKNVPSGRVASYLDDEEEHGLIRRNRGWLITVALLALGGGAAFLSTSPKETAPRKTPAPTMVRIELPPLPPPPPPPPPPPEQQPPPEQKEEQMIEQAPVEEAEPKADDNPPDEPPSDPIGTNIAGDGPADGFGLGRAGNGGLGGTGRGLGRSGGSQFGWYAGQVQSRIAEAMRKNRRTRNASIRGMQVRVWPDSTGRITKVQLAGSTGDSATDAALENNVLKGLQLQEPPPAGMRMPIVLRLNARRPN